ncbi:MAG: hypothetical protein JSR58_02055 [Verrucomicrobia bacterium]|nr:hypothetical protein [Verrucomicrobiota bacterium]
MASFISFADVRNCVVATFVISNQLLPSKNAVTLCAKNAFLVLAPFAFLDKALEIMKKRKIQQLQEDFGNLAIDKRETQFKVIKDLAVLVWDGFELFAAASPLLFLAFPSSAILRVAVNCAVGSPYIFFTFRRLSNLVNVEKADSLAERVIKLQEKHSTELEKKDYNDEKAELNKLLKEGKTESLIDRVGSLTEKVLEENELKEKKEKELSFLKTQVERLSINLKEFDVLSKRLMESLNFTLARDEKAGEQKDEIRLVTRWFRFGLDLKLPLEEKSDISDTDLKDKSKRYKKTFKNYIMLLEYFYFVVNPHFTRREIVEGELERYLLKPLHFIQKFRKDPDSLTYFAAIMDKWKQLLRPIDSDLFSIHDIIRNRKENLMRWAIAEDSTFMQDIRIREKNLLQNLRRFVFVPDDKDENNDDVDPLDLEKTAIEKMLEDVTKISTSLNITQNQKLNSSQFYKLILNLDYAFKCYTKESEKSDFWFNTFSLFSVLLYGAVCEIGKRDSPYVEGLFHFAILIHCVHEIWKKIATDFWYQKQYDDLAKKAKAAYSALSEAEGTK